MAPILSLLLVAPTVPGQSAPPLVTAAAVRVLTNERADRPYGVDLTGVVTQVAPNRLELFLQDGTCGVCVRVAGPLADGVRRGARVRVLGRTEGGWFSPIVIGSRVRVLGDGALPEPLPFDLSATGSRWLDGQYVQCHALVREAGVADGRGQLIVEGAGGRGRLVFLHPIGEDELRRWVGTVVRARGVCIPEFDADRRATGAAVIGLSAASDVRAVQTVADVAAIPARTVAHLRQHLPGTSPVPLVRTEGTVVARTGPDVLVVQDRTGGCAVRLRTDGAGAFPAGTRVRVTGFLVWNEGRIRLDGAEASADGTTVVPNPIEVAGERDVPDADGCRVRVRGSVTAVSAEHWTVAVGGATVAVRRPTGAPSAVEVGCTVAVTGTLVTLDRAGAPLLLVDSPADVTIETAPERPWLTRAQARIAAAGASAVLALAICWVVALRAAVRARTRQLAASEEKFAAAFRNSPDALVIARASDGRLVDANDRFSEITGRAVPGELTEIPWADTADRARLTDQIRANGRVRGFAARVRSSTGELRDVVLASEPVSIGGVPCLLGTIRDVTVNRTSSSVLTPTALSCF